MAIGFTACDSSADGDGDEIDLAPVLANMAQNVILATYNDLDQAAMVLLTSCNTLASATTAPNLEAARTAWRAARVPWESSEGFLFGPVDQFGLDPALDTWPVDEIAIEAILTGSDALTQAFVANQDVDSGLKGFHVIEYLLFGAVGEKETSDFTVRELEYLTAAAEVLADDAEVLFESWNPSGDNYMSNLVNAGQSGSQFVSAKDALLTLADALVGIADEVGAGKMQGPLDEGILQVESRFSGNSKADFQNNIRSIQHVYLGDYGSVSGSGITDLVAELDSDLDEQVRTEIAAAISEIGAITGEFRTAITTHRSEVEDAIAAVITLKTSLEQMIVLLDESF